MDQLAKGATDRQVDIFMYRWSNIQKDERMQRWRNRLKVYWTNRQEDRLKQSATKLRKYLFANFVKMSFLKSKSIKEF